MKVLVNGLFLFLAAFVIHLGWWRIRVPAKQTRILLFIQGGAFLLWYCISIFPGEGLPVPMAWFAMEHAQRLHVLIFYISMVLAYDVLYSALEVDSPTVVMMKTIDEAGSDGVDKEHFLSRLDNEILVRPRVNDLIRDKFAVLDNGGYSLTGKGRVMAFIFSSYRKLLGRPVLGG